MNHIWLCRMAAGRGECYAVKGNMEERAQRLALYIIENQTTVRAAAGRFGISKSTVHTEVINWNGLYGRYSKKPM